VAVGDADEDVAEVVPAFIVVGAEGVVGGATKVVEVAVEDLVDDAAEEDEGSAGENVEALALVVDGAAVDVDGANAGVEAPPNVAREVPALEPEPAPTPVE
jgi:hypothetical protein